MELYYVTNRRHEGDDRWRPTGYGKDPSGDGFHNLRYGCVTFDETSLQPEIDAALSAVVDGGHGDGGKVAKLVRPLVKQQASIEAFEESPDGTVRGSTTAYDRLRSMMQSGVDVVIYVHGFNVDWHDAVASASALQIMLNAKGDKDVAVVLFSWPSDGQALLYIPYFSDRDDASHSRLALCRALLTLQDRLHSMRKETISGSFTTRRDYLKAVEAGKIDVKKVLCRSGLHLLCHSMGNYVLECALEASRFNPEYALADRMFEHVFLCAPDVTTDALEPGKPLAKLADLSELITVYYNKQDAPLIASMSTKHARERLGRTGASRPSSVDRSFMQVDCTPVVTDGVVEHSYYLNGATLYDICQSINGTRQSTRPWRIGDPVFPNAWALK